jgi:hypothetical protein
MSGMVLQPTQSPITSTSGTISPEVMRPDRKDTLLTPQSSEGKNKWINKSTCLHEEHEKIYLHRTISEVVE